MRRHGGSLRREFFVTIIAHRTETAVCIEGDYVGMSQGRIEGFDLTKSQGHIGSKVSTKHKICSNYSVSTVGTWSDSFHELASNVLL